MIVRAGDERPWTLQPGDVLACYGSDFLSRMITWGTATIFAGRRLRLGPSHMAIIAEKDGSPIWIESTMLCPHPCIVQGLHARGVQAHLPEYRVHDYVARGGRVDLYRLSPIDALSKAEAALLTEILFQHFLGRGVNYDTGGALISGTRVLKRARLLSFIRDADLDAIFCSELIAAVLMRLHRMNRDNPTKFSPAHLLRRLVKEGTYQFVGRVNPTSEGLIFVRERP